MGNGRLVKFWVDVWIGEEPLQNLALYPLTDEMLRKSVRDYLQSERERDWMAFNSFLPSCMLMKLVVAVVQEPKILRIN